MAMGIITTGSAPKLLWPGLDAIFGQTYNEHGLECKKLFDTKPSTKAYEEVQEIIAFGLAPEKEQGTSTQYGAWRQGFTSRFTNRAYALGFIVTREEIKDNQYEQVARQRTQRLAFSMRTTKEIVGANIYNRGFDALFPGADGSSLFATDHDTDIGSQSNALTVPADLSEASLEDMLIQIEEAQDSAGLPIALRGKSLNVHPNEMFNATRILNSVLQNDTANNAINAIRDRGMLADGINVNHYFTDRDAWFVRTDVPDGLTNYEREPMDFSEDNDFDTENMKYKCYERYSFFWADWRSAFGSPGA